MAFEGPLEDRMAIRELVDSYGDAVCRHDAKSWGANWLEEAVWTVNLPGITHVEGRKAIVELWVKAMAEYEFVLMSASPAEIVISRNQATGRFYTWEITRLKTGEEQRITGSYRDVYAKMAGRWYFKSRDYTVLHLQSLGTVRRVDPRSDV